MLPVWGLKTNRTAILEVTNGDVEGPRLSPSNPPPKRAKGA